MDQQTTEAEEPEYEAPAVVDLGSLEELTLSGANTDITEGLKT